MLIFLYRWTDWIRCRTKCAEFATSQQQDSTLEHSLVKVANPSLDGLATTRVSFKNAKTIIVVSSIKKTVQLARLVVSENA